MNENKVLFQGKGLTVTQREFERAGKLTRWEVVERPPAAACVVLNDKDEVLLVNQYRAPVDDLTKEIPAGQVDPGETPDAAIIRELREETGIEVQQLRLLCKYFPGIGYSNEQLHIYTASAVGGDFRKASERDKIQPEFVPFAQALTFIANGKIRDGKSIIGLLMMKDLGVKHLV